jgi:uncharacterized protein
VNFEWDDNKNKLNIEVRKVDFEYAALIFEGPVFTSIDTRKEYGEDRFISLGMVDDEIFVVVHTERNGSTRIITAWKGGRDDRSKYQARFAHGNQEEEGSGQTLP